MSCRDWKPGDVIVDVDGARFFVVDHAPVDPETTLYNAPCVVDADGNGWKRDTIENARALAVIDPESEQDAVRLADLYRTIWEGPEAHTSVSAMQAALREFANPTPPKPDEPTGLGAVVEDVQGERWVRFRDASGRVGAYWMNDSDDMRRYASLVVENVLSEGVRDV